MDNNQVTQDTEVKDDVSFKLDASEEELLEEFGVLLSAEYGYGASVLA